jgi:hypothetical protein
VSAWPTIEWLATRTSDADGAVPREEAERLVAELARLEAAVKRAERREHVPILERGDRGFHGYGEPMRCSYGTEVKVFESSDAESPHVWLDLDASSWIKERYSRESFANAAAHLNEAQARALIARLQTWIDEIPARWSREGAALEG